MNVCIKILKNVGARLTSGKKWTFLYRKSVFPIVGGRLIVLMTLDAKKGSENNPFLVIHYTERLCNSFIYQFLKIRS